MVKYGQIAKHYNLFFFNFSEEVALSNISIDYGYSIRFCVFLNVVFEFVLNLFKSFLSKINFFLSAEILD